MRRVADRLAAVLNQPFVLDGRQRFVSASFGLALADGGRDADALLRDADAAMYHAKEQGKARLEFFDELAAHAGARAPRARGRTARRACAGSSSSLPAEIALATGALYGMEALLRWKHPMHGIGLPRPLRPDRRAERPDRPDRRVGAPRPPAARPPNGAPPATRTS